MLVSLLIRFYFRNRLLNKFAFHSTLYMQKLPLTFQVECWTLCWALGGTSCPILTQTVHKDPMTTWSQKFSSWKLRRLRQELWRCKATEFSVIIDQIRTTEPWIPIVSRKIEERQDSKTTRWVTTLFPVLISYGVVFSIHIIFKYIIWPLFVSRLPKWN